MPKKKRWKPTGRIGTRSNPQPSRRSVAARNQLVVENRGLVFATVKKHRGIAAQDREDAAQYGLLGLIRAAELYDETRTEKFSTYAVAVIKQWLIRWVRTNRLIHIPEYLLDKRGRTLAEMSKTVAEHMADAARASAITGSVVAAIDTRHNIDREQEIGETSQRLADAIRYLDPVARDVLHKRFVRGWKLHQIAASMRPARSKERVRQIEFDALQKLRLIFGVPLLPSYRRRSRAKHVKQPGEFPISGGGVARPVGSAVSTECGAEARVA